MLLFLSISCEQEEIMDIDSSSFFEQQKSSKSKNISKLSDEQLIEQIVDLKNGTKKAYHKYNKKYPNQNFNIKFGKPIVKEIKYIQFTDEDYIIMILPLEKKNNNKSKLLLAYYKNGKKTYKVFTNKKYKRNDNESVSESNLLNNLSVIFNKKLKRKTESQKGELNKGDDGWRFVDYRYGGCVEEWVNIYSGETWYQANQESPCPDEKGDSEIYDEWDEPTDPDTPDDTGDINDYCDSGDPTCDDGTGGSTGGDDSSDIDNSTDDFIIDNLTGRSKCVYEKLNDQNGNLFKTTIGKFIEDPKYNLVLINGNCISSNTACTKGSKIEETGEVFIIIEDNYEPSLEMASTILHEGIHAEIFRYVNQFEKGEDPNNRIRLFELYTYYTGIDEDGITHAQHQYMVEYYVTPIAKAIRTLDNNRYSLSYYMGFGWDGLEEYGYYGTLTRTQSDENKRLMAIVNANTEFNDCE